MCEPVVRKLIFYSSFIAMIFNRNSLLVYKRVFKKSLANEFILFRSLVLTLRILKYTVKYFERM